ncbi:hypothetical protein ER308_09115 [Egibacter rhizosphaerae]|uniref:DUF2178 domain-containing protein n=1 Tax=Egibacter rhizosphaerae TaxID=1670831 RepID=A0A411YES4_9ACTN|nr:hypothetical protein [Egibacter rhizosphaerae]QBI19691.1 hypothetical protein ER308_09115 [Egibacter rhizosphaerae]
MTTADRPSHRPAAPGRRRPVWVPLFSLALGVIGLLVPWLAADALDVGLRNLGIMTAFAAILWLGQRFEVVQILSRDHHTEERHATIQLRATSTAYIAVVAVAVVGFFWELAQGAPGPFTLIAAVGGFTHIAATIVLRFRL